MVLPDFDPVAISLGPLPLRWYALAYVAGIMAGWWYATQLAQRQSLWAPNRSPLDKDGVADLAAWIILGIILGGRLGFALFYNPSLYPQLFTGETLGQRFELLQIWTGGMSFHGGFIGVSIAIILFARSKGANLLSVGDLIAPVVPIGLFTGRLANFINGELWGRPSDAPWAINFCNARNQEIYGPACNYMGFGPGDVARHPSQLYEAGLEGLLLFAILAFAVWKLRLLAKPGYVTGLFLVGYGLSRAVLETVREPDAHMPEFLQGHVTMGMMLSIPMILVGAWLIWRAWSRPPYVAPPPAAG